MFLLDVVVEPRPAPTPEPIGTESFFSDPTKIVALFALAALTVLLILVLKRK